MFFYLDTYTPYNWDNGDDNDDENGGCNEEWDKEAGYDLYTVCSDSKPGNR